MKSASHTIKANETLDVRKQVCPMPVLLTKRKLQTMQNGDILEVIGDYPQAAKNIQRFAKQDGHQILKAIERSGTFEVYIKKRH